MVRASKGIGADGPVLRIWPQLPELQRGWPRHERLVMVMDDAWIFVAKQGGSLHRIAKGGEVVGRKRVAKTVVWPFFDPRCLS